MKVKFIATMCFLALYTGTANAKESGSQLHESKCLACHSTSVYTRSDRKVKSLTALSQRVNMCAKGGARTSWTKKQIDSVTDYLNNRFYKF